MITLRKVKVDANDSSLAHLNEELDRLAAARKEYDAREAALAQRQRECEEREEKLRGRVRKLEDDLEGVYRTLVATSADKVIEIGTDVFPEHVVELAKRTLKAQGHRIPRILEQKNGVN